MGDGRAFQPDEDRRSRLVLAGEIAAEIAHELRNVLQIIGASAFVARQTTARGDAGGALEHVVKIERNTRIALGIVDDLMVLARGEAIRCEAVPIADVVAAARADLLGGPRWHDELEPPHLSVRANPGLLTRLIHALYDNAVHASNATAPTIAPTITTRARAASGRVVIEVADDGPGVPPEIAARVFDPLVTARPGGTGLGLALAQRIAVAHGGSIVLVDPAGLPGATFRIDLPAPA
jgi:signal transduction histidine kinase